MAIFEYRCRECDNRHEQIVNGRNSPTPCPYCQNNSLEKLISVPARAQFTGHGFYETDYKYKPKPTESDDE